MSNDADAENKYWADVARAKEAFRQDQITEGLKNLARIFEGGDYGSGLVNARDVRAGQTYYTADGQEYRVPFHLGGAELGQPAADPGFDSNVYVYDKGRLLGSTGELKYGPAGYTQHYSTVQALPSGGYNLTTYGPGGVSPTTQWVETLPAGYQWLPAAASPSGSPAAQATKSLGEVFGLSDSSPESLPFLKIATDLPQLYREKATTTGFNDAFFNRQRDAYTQYALPQVAEQNERARRDLAFSLSRAGTADSTTATRRYADLNKDVALKQQEVADTAQNLAQQSRADVASARERATNILYSQNDPGEAARVALEQANQLATNKPTYSPLGVMFTNATAGLAGAVDSVVRNNAEQRLRAQYSGLRDPSTSSGRTVRT